MAASPISGAVQWALSTDAAGLNDDLWRFALSFYGRDGVSAACLALQQGLGIDVDILLFAVFAQVERGIAFDMDELRTIDAIVRDWRTEIVQTLRQLRTRLKSGSSLAPSSATDGLRNQVKAMELEAERIELKVLADWLDRQPARAIGSAVEAEPPRARCPLLRGGHNRGDAGARNRSGSSFAVPSDPAGPREQNGHYVLNPSREKRCANTWRS
jgi:uncharacterized protein (TIGR02444 family)